MVKEITKGEFIELINKEVEEFITDSRSAAMIRDDLGRALSNTEIDIIRQVLGELEAMKDRMSSDDGTICMANIISAIDTNIISALEEIEAPLESMLFRTTYGNESVMTSRMLAICLGYVMARREYSKEGK
jgi:hypothetical protein